MTDSSVELRVSVARYVQVMVVFGFALMLCGFVAAATDALIDGRDLPKFINGTALIMVRSIVLLFVVFDLLKGWGYPIWRVHDRGIVVFATKRSQPRFVPWADIASIRVYPLGVVTMRTTGKPVRVSVVVGVSTHSALWLRNFATAKLAKDTVGGDHCS